MPRIISCLAAAMLLACCIRPACANQTASTSSGTFTDRTGKQHSWSISAAHALTWDKATYVPVGGVFCPRYLAEAATEENWAADVKALETLKAKGALDILVNPVVSAVEVTPAAWQRVIDYLDANGFRYGMAFGAGLRTPLTGYVVKPGSYRLKDIQENTDPAWSVTDADTAEYVIADKTGSVQKCGALRVQNGYAAAAWDPAMTPDSIALLYPHKVLRASPDGVLPDLWTGFDAYRDRLLSVLGQVKFGGGLRFFLDPLAHPLSVLGESEYLVPDSPAFRLEWEAYLSRKYEGSIDNLIQAWRLVERDVKDFRYAATLVPLWSGQRGVPYLLDPATGKALEADRNASLNPFWADLRECRNDSLVYYVNAVADVLKRQVADVPVVYTYTHQHRMFTNPNRSGGFDGLGIAAYARGSALVTGGADAAYSQVGESSRTMWLMVAETLDSGARSQNQIGYGSEAELAQNLNWLRGIGAKGFYVNGFQVLPESGNSRLQLLQAPQQIDWLMQYAKKIDSSPNLGQVEPRTLPYPASAAGLVHSGPTGAGGAIFVPSLAPGHPLEYGASYAGYTITAQDGGQSINESVLWCRNGPRLTHLEAKDARGITITTADGIPVPFKVDARQRAIVLTMDQNPIVIRGAQEDAFPVEAAEDVMKALDILVAEGEKAKEQVQQFRYGLDNALHAYRAKNPRLAFAAAAEALNGIAGIVQPFCWLEGEQADPQSFSEAAPNEAASGGSILVLNTETKPPAQGYAAQYQFTAPTDDNYFIWIACTPPGAQASPFSWLIDTGDVHSSTEGTVVGLPYLGGRLAWTRLGRVNVKKGPHTLTLRVSDRAPGSDRYTLAIDSLLITRFPFTPDGTAKPPVADVANRDMPKMSGFGAISRPPKSGKGR